jgi:hypothetical protein
MWYALLLLSVLAQAHQKQLLLVAPTLLQFEDGPPIYSNHRYIPGETVFFAFQVRGYAVSPEQKIHLTFRIEATDSAGVRMVEEKKGEIQAILQAEDKDWSPKVRHTLLIPPHAGPGDYSLVASLKDMLSGQEAKVELSFPVQGRLVEPSETLAVRNFRFLRNEQDTQPMNEAVYRGGESLWAKFDVVGFNLGENNRFHVEYDVSILSADGTVLFTQQQAALDEGAPFYPKRHVPSVVSLTIQEGTRAASYAIQVSVRDQVGQQTVESKHTFRIE